MVKAAPNRALVVAKIESIRKTKEPKISLVTLHVISSEPVLGYEDFVSQNYTGKTIEVKLIGKDKQVIDDNPVKLLVTYKGDERSGSFFAELSSDD